MVLACLQRAHVHRSRQLGTICLSSEKAHVQPIRILSTTGLACLRTAQASSQQGALRPPHQASRRANGCPAHQQRLRSCGRGLSREPFGRRRRSRSALPCGTRRWWWMPCSGAPCSHGPCGEATLVQRGVVRERAGEGPGTRVVRTSVECWRPRARARAGPCQGDQGCALPLCTVYKLHPCLPLWHALPCCNWF